MSSNITTIKRPQAIGQEMIDDLREVLNAAERGEVTDLLMVANMADNGEYFRATQFTDGWRLIGALEYAKDGVLRGMGE